MANHKKSNGKRKALPPITSKKIRNALLSELQDKPAGVPLSDLVKRVRSKWPHELKGPKGYSRIWGQVWWMEKKDMIERAAPAVWRCVSPSQSPQPQVESDMGNNEAEWYKPVKEQLVEMEECKFARVVGNQVGPGRWSNPDIVGAIVPSTIARANGFKSEIMAVEVKRAKTAAAFLTGFAQACCYQNFAHMALLVVPEWDDLVVKRVKRLCKEHGVGFAVFVEDNKSELRLEIQISPRSKEPDSKEFTEFLKRLSIRRIEELR